MARKFPMGINLQGQKAINVGDPSDPADGINLQYLQNFIRGLINKDAVRAATTAALTISSPGASIDGVALNPNDRVLVKNQATLSENGIYVWAASGSPLIRAVDADSGNELRPGTTVYVTEGTANADKNFSIISDTAITIGTTAQTWGITGGAASNYSNGLGLLLASGVFSIDTSVVVRKFAAIVGDGSATSITVTHNLGTKRVQSGVRLVATDEEIYPDVSYPTNNTATYLFASAPATGSVDINVQG